jgi:hypothetical protein
MGFSLGGASGGTSDTQKTSGSTTSTGSSSGTASNTYSPWQTLLQSQLGTTLSSLLNGVSSGTLSPDVQAQKTAAADTINKNYTSLGDRMNRVLAARGFGQSGTTGSTALKTELARQGDLAANESNFAGLQLNQNQNFLSDALMAAFNAMGRTASGTTSGATTNEQNTTDNGSNWGFGGGVSFGRH